MHGIGYDNLIQGIYETTTQYDELPKEWNFWLQNFSQDVDQLSTQQTIINPIGVVIVQQWQANLKRVVVRIKWMENKGNGDTAYPKTSEATVFVHKNSTGGGVDGKEAGGKR
jgi:hypothetical protein